MPEFKIGDSVVCTHYPFKGLRGTVTRIICGKWTVRYLVVVIDKNVVNIGEFTAFGCELEPFIPLSSFQQSINSYIRRELYV